MQVSEPVARVVSNMNMRTRPIDFRQRDRDLEEAQSRTAQLEKTMQWWSECTASWREKWAKLRDERNLLKDKLSNSQNALELANKNLEYMTSERDRLLYELRCLEKPLTSPRSPNVTSSGKYIVEPGQSTETLGYTVKTKIKPMDCLKIRENLTESNLNQLSSTLYWWKTQCTVLEQEVRYLFDIGAKRWSKCELLSHSNRLLRQENDVLKKEIANLQSLKLKQNITYNNCDRKNNNLSSYLNLRRRGSAGSVEIDATNEAVRLMSTNDQSGLENVLSQQLGERDEQLRLLQCRLSNLVHERNSLSHQLSEMNKIKEQCEDKIESLVKQKLCAQCHERESDTKAMNYCANSYLDEINSACEFISTVKQSSNITNIGEKIDKKAVPTKASINYSNSLSELSESNVDRYSETIVTEQQTQDGDEEVDDDDECILGMGDHNHQQVLLM